MLILKCYSALSGILGKRGLPKCQGPGEEGYVKSTPFLFLFREFSNMPMQSLPIKFSIFSPDKRWPLLSFYFWPSHWTGSTACLRITHEINIPGVLHHPTRSTTFLPFWVLFFLSFSFSETTSRFGDQRRCIIMTLYKPCLASQTQRSTVKVESWRNGWGENTFPQEKGKQLLEGCTPRKKMSGPSGKYLTK